MMEDAALSLALLCAVPVSIAICVYLLELWERRGRLR